MLTTANCRSCLLGQAHWRFLDILCSIHVLPQTCQAFIRPYPSRWGHDMLRLPRAFHQHMFYVPSTYVLRLINICSTFINISSTSHQRLINVSSTRDRRLIYEGSTSHLRGTLKRNESMFHLSPNQVLLAAFSCTKQVDGKPKQLAWACHLLAKSLPSPCHLLAKSLPSTCEVLAIYLRSPCQPFAISLRNPGLSFPFLFLISLDGFHRLCKVQNADVRSE